MPPYATPPSVSEERLQGETKKQINSHSQDLEHSLRILRTDVHSDFLEELLDEGNEIVCASLWHRCGQHVRGKRAELFEIRVRRKAETVFHDDSQSPEFKSLSLKELPDEVGILEATSGAHDQHQSGTPGKMLVGPEHVSGSCPREERLQELLDQQGCTDRFLVAVINDRHDVDRGRRGPAHGFAHLVRDGRLRAPATHHHLVVLLILRYLDCRRHGRDGRHLLSPLPSADQLFHNSISTNRTYGTGKQYAGQRAKPPQCLLRHLDADAVRSQRLDSLYTCKVVDESARGVVKIRENDKDGVDVVQARRRHLSDAPGPVKNLFGAKYHKRLRLLANNCEQQAQILEVVRIQKDIARHLSVAQQAYLQQSTKGTSPNFVVAQEELEGLPQSEGTEAKTPSHGDQEGTHDAREDREEQVSNDLVVRICLEGRKNQNEQQACVHGDIQVVRVADDPRRRGDAEEDAGHDHGGRSEEFAGQTRDRWYHCQGEVPKKQHKHIAVGSGTKSEEQEGERVQKHGVALMQPFRQGEGNPGAQGHEGQWNQARDSADDQHSLVVALGVPTHYFAVRLHGAQPVRVHFTLQWLHNGRAHRDVHGTDHRTDGTEQCWHELSELRPPELREVEHQDVHEVTDGHAHYKDHDSEGAGHVLCQRRCGHDAAEIEDFQLEVHERPHLDDRRHRLRPCNGQRLEYAQHLQEGDHLTAEDGSEREAVHLLGLVLPHPEAVHAPQESKCEETGANQQAQVGTSARLSSHKTVGMSLIARHKRKRDWIVWWRFHMTFCGHGKNQQLDKTRCRALQGPSLVMRE